MPRIVTVTLRQGRLAVYSSSETVDRMWVANGEHEILAAEVTDVVLGEAVERMLAASRAGVPTPPADEVLLRPMLTSLGLRSYRVFAKSARSVHVEAKGDTVTVIPFESRDREGFQGVTERQRRLSRPTTTQLGGAVRVALAEATE